MAGSVNKVILIGNLGHDPSIRSFSNGNRAANLSLATSESWKDKATGERKEKTQWHKIVIKNTALVDIAEKYLKKGAKIYIEGQLETRKYTDKDGADKYTTEVILAPYRGILTMLDGRGGTSDSVSDEYQGDPEPSATPSTYTPLPDDEIPF